MEAQQIKLFIDAMASSDLAEMEFSQDGWTLRLVRAASGAAPSRSSRSPGLQRPPAGGAGQSQEITPTGSTEVRAPLYGVVHLQPAPDQPPFVAAGIPIKAGQTLCMIEAMKVFNEVRAERDATVQAVLVTSGQEVEVGQALLRLA